MASIFGMFNIGGSGVWPHNDPPGVGEDPSPHGDDGYRNRMPGGCHYENPTEWWVDQMVYPDRPVPHGDADEPSMTRRSRDFRVSRGNKTGRNPGPSDDDE